MQVFLPKPKLPVLVGPPAPPAPTLVQFDRNVVVLRGKLDDGPDQLTCDTLKLSLVPEEKPARRKRQHPSRPRPKPGTIGRGLGSDDESRSATRRTDRCPRTSR